LIRPFWPANVAINRKERVMPTEAALAAAYQVVGRCLTSEDRLIWQKTTLFVAVNSLVLAGLHSFPNLPTWASIGVVIVGGVYGLLWHFSMARAWKYHQYYMQFARELEGKLQLGDAGLFTRGRVVISGGKHKVGDEDIEFGRTLVPARMLAYATTWAFVLVYVIIFFRSL
jgi:hypothetical protein